MFYLLDIIIALAIPLTLIALRRAGRLSTRLWRVFWLGTLLGLTWELPFYFLGPEYQAAPLFVLLGPWPLPPILQPLIHTLWDGGIFVVGLIVVGLLCPAPTFDRFRWRELLVLVAWGVSSAAIVEVLGSRGGWAYVPRWWNPALFMAGGTPVTLLPIAVWAVAPTLLYIALLATSRRTHTPQLTI
ncbi:MAG: hypothetical protein HGA45_17110 [Chloroflexales bacterium]|nr:hypothetical protein [Chloroflexales bacterium]